MPLRWSEGEMPCNSMVALLESVYWMFLKKHEFKFTWFFGWPAGSVVDQHNEWTTVLLSHAEL